MINKISSNNSSANSLIYGLENKETSKKDEVNSVALEIISNSEVDVYQEKKQKDVSDDKILNLSGIESNDSCIFLQKEDLLKKQNSFERVCRNVIDNQEVNKIIKSLPNGAEKALLLFLEQGKWDEIARWDRNMLAYQAYDLFRQGKILYTQFATCMFFHTFSKNIYCIPLFVNGENNPVAFNLLCEGFGEGNWDVVDKKMVGDVFNRMRNVPKSEKYFFFSYDQFPKKNNQEDVCSRLRKIDFNLLNEGSIELNISPKNLIAKEEKRIEINERMLCEFTDCCRKLRNKNIENEKILEKMNVEIELEEKRLEILKINLDLNNKILRNAKKEKNVLDEDSQRIYLEKINKINLLKYNYEKLFLFSKDVNIEIDKKNKEILFLAGEINNSKIQLKKLQKKLENGKTVAMERPGRIVASLSMMQAFVNVLGKENAITFTPVIGVSTIEDIKNNGKWGTRDIALAFPGVDLPEEADGYFIRTPFDFSYHDFYHGCSASLASNEVRLTCLYIAEMVDSKNNEELTMTEYPDFARYFVELLIDMEMSDYLPGSCNNVDIKDRGTVQMLRHLDSIMSRALWLYKKDNKTNFIKIKFKTGMMVKDLLRLMIKNKLIAPSLSLNTRILVNNSYLSGNKSRLFTQKYMEML